jgi:hypothetical protein
MAETLIRIIGSTQSVVSLSSGYKVAGQATIYIPISKVQFDAALCADLAAHITHGHITVTINGVAQTATDMSNLVGSPISEEIKEHSDFQESVSEFHDPTGALPVAPTDGLRFWSTATANGWTINRIYVWSAATSSYEDVVPTAGMQVYVESAAMLYLWNGTSLNSFVESTQIRCRITAIDLKALAAYTGITNGISTDRFIPTNLIFRVTAVGGAALTGDTFVSVGTSAGGTQILPITQLTGLIGLNTSFSVPIAGLVNVAILANSVLHCSITTADTSAGTGTAELWITGFSI